MAYMTLYRKYRPAEFAEVKGQDHIVTTLKNQINSGRIGHAYLFCGTRGTGKTTVAKIFAMAVNCEHPVDGSPCGECPSCRAIASGSSMNVIEIDAASNNGVESIRQIREEVSYPPTDASYKVYIIDEAHMLTTAAWNALLKTIEEPPAYVIFIFATTDTRTIPVTVLSRCQRYDFRRISIDTIAQRLTDLLAREQVEAEDKAIRYLARAADGSMRDALSLADQCIAFNFGKKLTLDRVLEVLGAADNEVFGRLLGALLDMEAAGAVGIAEDILMQGKELGEFVNDFVWYLRNLLLIRASDRMEDVLDMSTENLARLKDIAERTDDDTIMHFIREFSELSGEMKYSPQKRVLLEVALIRLCRPAMEPSRDTLEERVAFLEKQLEDGIPASAAPQGVNAALGMNTAQGMSAEEPADREQKKPEIPVAISEDLEMVRESWDEIIATIEKPLGLYLKRALPSPGDGNQLLLIVDEDWIYDYLKKHDEDMTITDSVSRTAGRQIEVVIRKNDTGRPANETYPDLRSENIRMIGMPVDVDDD